jgi:hypothetical protein
MQALYGDLMNSEIVLHREKHEYRLWLSAGEGPRGRRLQFYLKLPGKAGFSGGGDRHVQPQGGGLADAAGHTSQFGDRRARCYSVFQK